MQSVSLGPLALPLNPLLMLAGAWLALWLAERLAGEAARAEAGRAVLRAALAGLLAARVAFVAGAWDLYAAEPWSLLDLRDGGWHAAAGVVAALAVLLAYAARRPGLRRPLALSAVAGIALWGGATTLLGVHQRAPMPQVTLADLQGRATTLRDAADGRPAVVNLWASWCAPCRAEMPVLAAAERRHTDVRWLMVNQGESADQARRYLASLPQGFGHVLLDAPGALGPAVGSAGLPTTLFYDAQGRLVERHMGVLSAASLEAKLRRLRAAGD